MSYVATALFNGGQQWSVADVDLTDAADIDAVVEALTDLDPDAKTSILLVEEDDEYVAITRVDGTGEPRVFVSDDRAMDTYPVVEAMTSGLELEPADPAEGLDEIAEDAPPGHDMAPAGDPDLLADVGTSGAVLLELCAHEGTLPGDVIAAICENAGCLAEYENLRG